MQRAFKLGVFTSSTFSLQCLQNLQAERFEDAEIEISNEGLEAATTVGKAMEKAGVEVIVSRRGTAFLLRENLRIPVISFPLSSLDIIHSVRRASALGRKVLFPVFRNKMDGTQVIEELLGIELIQGIYYDSKSLENLLLDAFARGCEVVVGGGVTKRLAAQHNFQAVEIEVSEDEICSTIENAKSVALSNRNDQENAQRYRQIIDSVSDGIIAFDRKGKITTINKVAKDVVKFFDEDKTSQLVSKYIPAHKIAKVMEARRPILNRIEMINNSKYVFSHLPILMGTEAIGVVSTFKDLANVMKAEKALRRSLTKGLVAKYVIGNLIHASPIMKDVAEKAKQFARSDCTIIITGETGTGKEILAQSIHNLSPRQKAPFVSINCASLPDQLIESELFGYDQGAFTGANKEGKQGLFEIAHKGTIFLDEVATTSHNVQTSLLRVLEEGEVRRIGADRLIPVDVRVLAAANQDLTEEVLSGRFRKDLFFRLNVLRIHIPPLRDRISDIPLLVDSFVKQVSEKYQIQPLCIPPNYAAKLMEYAWPGNVRQLKSFIEQLVLLCGSKFNPGTFELLSADLIAEAPSKKNTGDKTDLLRLKEEIQQEEKDNETRLLLVALKQARFCKSETAKILGISRTTLWRRLKNAGIT
ncbi:MAG: sigma 54-interacting transcriptional regulator [Desulfobacterales bacterium]|nr:MAG: sigma 54-interacting transcriptional regulator [Desulfobacterales bacterium]